jgi:hypothetical protein
MKLSDNFQMSEHSWPCRFHIICKQKTIDNCTWNLSLKFIEVRIFCYLMPLIGKNMISWFYAYVEHIEIKTKTVNIMHFPYLDLSQNVKIRDVPYSLKSPRNSECKLAHIYGMNKGKVFMSCVLYTYMPTLPIYAVVYRIFKSSTAYRF